MAERNALAELAERMHMEVEERILTYPNRQDYIKAIRIIKELAKVPDCTFKGNPRVDKSADAVIACRAIAEEGAEG